MVFFGHRWRFLKIPTHKRPEENSGEIPFSDQHSIEKPRKNVSSQNLFIIHWPSSIPEQNATVQSPQYMLAQWVLYKCWENARLIMDLSSSESMTFQKTPQKIIQNKELIWSSTIRMEFNIGVLWPLRVVYNRLEPEGQQYLPPEIVKWDWRSILGSKIEIWITSHIQRTER